MKRRRFFYSLFAGIGSFYCFKETFAQNDPVEMSLIPEKRNGIT